jgi:hypothetical protein
MSGIQQGLIASLGGELIELADVFTATVYEGNGASRTITTNIDTVNKGGLIWIKNLDRSDSGHGLFSTAYGIGGNQFLTTSGHDGVRILSTNGVSPGAGSSNVGFTAAGFTLSTDTAQSINNYYVEDYLALTMRKAPKFFDVVTWTGNGGASQTISHNLGSAPGFITCKATSTTGDWWCYHRATSATPDQDYGVLNSTNSWNTTVSNFWAATSTTFTAQSVLNLNTNGVTYVAFIFAHDAGGFGASRALNAVNCGAYAGTGSLVQVNCGFASSARFVMIKRTDSTGSWFMWDSTRGIVAGNDPYILANTQAAQVTATDDIDTFASGFELPASSGVNVASASYIYLAIA